jgi:hypothetical protein
VVRTSNPELLFPALHARSLIDQRAIGGTYIAGAKTACSCSRFAMEREDVYVAIKSINYHFNKDCMIVSEIERAFRDYFTVKRAARLSATCACALEIHGLLSDSDVGAMRKFAALKATTLSMISFTS